jgi:hypothetical protein
LIDSPAGKGDERRESFDHHRCGDTDREGGERTGHLAGCSGTASEYAPCHQANEFCDQVTDSASPSPSRSDLPWPFSMVTECGMELKALEHESSSDHTHNAAYTQFTPRL